MKRSWVIAVLASGLAFAPAWAQLNPASVGSGMVATGGAAWMLMPYAGASHAGLGLALGDRYRLGLGVATGATRPGETPTAPRLPSAYELSWRQRDLYALYAEPGYALGAATLLYGKVSYLGGRGEDLYVDRSVAKPYTGLGLGGGMRTMLGEGLYLQLEFLYGDYEWQGMRATSLRPASATGSVGLGWRF